MANQFENLRSIGQGGMATVYSATDSQLGRNVAIKELAASLATNERYLVMFVSEARKMAAVNHPNVVNILSIDDDGTHAPRIVMELAKGTFQDYLDAGPCEPVLVERMARHVLQGLDAIHQAQIVHRDVKPANILYFENGYFKIGDFGIATDGEEHTQLLATPKYMAPEVLTRPHLVGQASDLYSLGLVLYEALLGTGRFVEVVERLVAEETSPSDPSRAAEAKRHLWQAFHGGRADLPRLHSLDSTIPEPLSGWIGKLVRKEIGERFQTCREALNALDRGSTVESARQLYDADMTQRVEPTAGRRGRTRTRVVSFAAVILLLLAGGAWLALRGGGRIPVEITSDPAGATILYAGEVVERTPHRTTMRPGATVTLDLAGYRPRDVTLPEGASSSENAPAPLHAELAWNRAVRLTSEPAGARAWLDDRQLGSTPLEVEGHGSVATVRLALEGYESVELSLGPGDEAIHAKLAPKLPGREAARDPRALLGALEPFLGSRDGYRLEGVVGSGGALRFGELLRLRATVPEPAWVALFVLQSSGDALLLYPSPRAEAVRLEGGRATVLPLARHTLAGYRLVASAPAGVDRAFLLSSPDPLPAPPGGQNLGAWARIYDFRPGQGPGANPALDLVRWAVEQRSGRPEAVALVQTEIRVEPGP